jgi:hypothetical protein
MRIIGSQNNSSGSGGFDVIHRPAIFAGYVSCRSPCQFSGTRAEAQGGQIMADGTNYNSRTIAIGIAAVIIAVLVIAWLAGAFQGLLEQPTTEAPQTETEPETTEPEAEEPAQQQ